MQFVKSVVITRHEWRDMKCPLCEQRKGKRFCPAERTSICAQCCGEKRMIEIDCPESCDYLKSGRERESEQEYRRFLRTADEPTRQKYFRVLSRLEEVVVYLEILIAEERRTVRDLADTDVMQALDLLIATLRTEDSGVLYERTSENLRVEGLRRALAEDLRSLRYPQQPDRERLLLKDAIECLELIRSMASSHVEPGAAPLSYVDFLARNMPKLRQHAQAGSRIIVPGR